MPKVKEIVGKVVGVTVGVGFTIVAAAVMGGPGIDDDDLFEEEGYERSNVVIEGAKSWAKSTEDFVVKTLDAVDKRL